MRRLLVLGVPAVAVLVAVAAATAASRPAPRVQTMVVGPTRSLLGARTLTLRAREVRIGRRRCSIPAGTALAGLIAARISVTVSDAAGCDPASMFVIRVGHDRNRGNAGWEYKVDHAAPSYGAADPAGRLHSGQQLLWFWCDRANSCQLTLSVKAARTATAGGSLPVTVLGYDDNGHRHGVAGASVHLGSATALSGTAGASSVPAPSTPGRYALSAAKPGLISSFPLEVSVK